MTKLKLLFCKEEILSMFDNGISAEQISKNLGEYPQSVINLIKAFRPGVKFAPDRGNIHYFEKIDSYAKAYITGFIAADGAIVKTKSSITLTITVKYEDRAILEFIKSEIGNSHKLQEIKRISSFDQNKMIHHSRYTISGKTLTDDLIKLGIVPNKSLILKNILVNIPEQFRDAFIIGYFDGNGSVTTINRKIVNNRGYLCDDHSLYISIRSTEVFLEGVCAHLGITNSHIRQYDSIPNLSFANKANVVRLFQCYKDLPFYFKRKHDKFLEKINHSSYDKYKQG